jgi:hypothetical protein
MAGRPPAIRLAREGGQEGIISLPVALDGRRGVSRRLFVVSSLELLRSKCGTNESAQGGRLKTALNCPEVGSVRPFFFPYLRPNREISVAQSFNPSH